ncbi:uncharacterized protein LOC144652150 isoform X2 [Oculina patagonica]
MADFSTAYQPVLEITKEFLMKDGKELTEENKERLERLGELAEILAHIEGERNEVKEVDQCTEAVKKLCQTLLFRNYTESIMKLADGSSMVSEIESKQKEDKSSKFPESKQVKINDFNYYLGKANGRIKEIDNMITELLPKVRKAVKNNFKIPDEEIADLEMDVTDVTCELEKCKRYLDEAEKAINQLESDITKEVAKFGIKIVAGVTGVASAVAVGGGILTAAKIVSLPLAELSEALGAAFLFGVAAVTGAVAFGLLVWKGRWFAKEKTYCKLLFLIFRNHRRL